MPDMMFFHGTALFSYTSIPARPVTQPSSRAVRNADGIALWYGSGHTPSKTHHLLPRSFSPKSLNGVLQLNSSITHLDLWCDLKANVLIYIVLMLIPRNSCADEHW
jgi:hypothetical protein